MTALRPQCIKPMHGERGFTLIEMMVALFIFGMIATASVVLLRQSVDAQAASGVRLDEMSALRRFNALAAQDFGSMVATVSRDENGSGRPAFAVNAADGALIGFTRYAPIIDQPDAASSLDRVEYGFADGAITRAVAPMANGVATGQAVPILSGVESVELRFRDSDGLWRSDWQPEQTNAIPVAIEFSLVRKDQGASAPLVLRFLTGVAP